MDCYPEAQETQKHMPQELEDIMEDFAKQPLRSENELAHYYRTFKAIAMGLLNQGDLTASNINKTLWFGLHRVTCKRIKHRLEVLKPDHDNSKPWTMEEVFVVGKKALLSRALNVMLRDQKDRLHPAGTSGW